MGAHDPPAGRDASIQHGLHDVSLIASLRQTNAEALPIAARPVRLHRYAETRNIRQQRLIARRQFPAPGDDLRQALELLAPHRRLNVGHAVIEAQLGVGLENHLR